jgi:hypothetical protein
MVNAILRLLLALIAQLPVATALTLWWDQVQQHPIGAAVIALFYEIFLFVLAFGKKVW